MSTIVSAAVWKHSAAKGTALLLLVSLADQANDDGWCWPSIENIGARCRISRRTVQRFLMELEKAGELFREERRGHSTHYRVLLGVPIADTRANLTPVPSDDTRDNLTPVSELRHPPVPIGDTGGVPTVTPRNVIEPSGTVSKPAKPRARQLPKDWHPTANHRGYANQHGLDLDHEADQFRNNSRAKGNTYINWDAAFNTWLGNAVKWGRGRPQPPKTHHDGRPEGW